MQLHNLLALCGTIAMCVSVVLAGSIEPKELQCYRDGPRCKTWLVTSTRDIEKLGTVTVPAKTKKLIQCKYYAGVHFENLKNHEIKVPAKQVADEVRQLVDLCPTDCGEKKLLQAVGKFDDHNLFMVRENCR